MRIRNCLAVCLVLLAVGCSDDSTESPNNIADLGGTQDMGDMSSDMQNDLMSPDMLADMGPDFPPTEPFLGIQPSTPTLNVGDTAQLTITFVDPMNNFMTEVTSEAMFVSEDNTVATVEGGLVTAVSVGSSVISIRARELTASTRVRVAPRWARVSAGAAHTCALAEDFTVHCWGDNSMGQLGVDGIMQSSEPVLVPDVMGTDIASGANHTCVVLFDETVQCWGDNASGQTGGGAVAPPELVQGVYAGASHTCAIAYQDPAEPDFGGSVFCWGATDAGQSPGTIARVGGAYEFASISAGANHTCGITTNGEAKCWGDNSASQLGDFQGGSSAAPVVVLPDAGARIIAGGNRACVSGGANVISCWGSAATGLGDGSTTTSATPVDIDLGAPVRLSTLSMGIDHACVSLQAGTVCWGANAGGELGNGEDDPTSTPDDVDGDPTFSQITTGDAHTCATTVQSGLFCFGINNNGQLGDGTTSRRRVPGQVLPPAAP